MAKQIKFPRRFEVRLARTEDDIRAAQRLRYRVFYEEMGAHAEPGVRLARRDSDPFDAICDHLLVVDRMARDCPYPKVVGTYRLARGSILGANQSFYTESEFELGAVREYPGEVVELGRSCIDAEYRNRAVLDMLWRGLGEYIAAHDIEVMFGCASFPGTDPDIVAEALTFLRMNCLAPEALRPRAHEAQYVDMLRLGGTAPDPRRALRQMPPLVRGYISAGCQVGDGAVIDPQFNTTDICVIIRTDEISESYCRRYQTPTAIAAAA